MIPERLVIQVRSTVVELDVIPSIRAQIEIELLTHMEQEFFELSLQGMGEHEAVEHILTSWGSSSSVAKNFASVYSQWSPILWLWYGVLTWIGSYGVFAIAGLLGRGIDSVFTALVGGALNPFEWIMTIFLLFDVARGGFSFVYLCVAGVLLALTYIFSRRVKRSEEEAKKLFFGISALGFFLSTVTLMVSFHPLTSFQSAVHEGVVNVAGFPFISVYFPSLMMGNDELPRSLWLNFFSNMAIWWGVGALIAAVTFRYWRFSKRHLKLLFIGGICLAVHMIVWLAFMFD